MSNPFEYRKLSPKARVMFGWSQLWLGGDHLLVVTSTRFAEKYQRFLLADIQAVTIADGADRIGWQIVAVTCSLLLLAGIFWADSRAGKVFFAVDAAIGLGLAIRDIVRGPRCTFVVQTAVSRERLPAVSRRRVAQEVIAQLRPAIEEAQASLAIEVAASAPPIPSSAPQPVGFFESAASTSGLFGPALPPPLPHRRNWVSEALFGLLLLDAMIVWAVLRFPNSGQVGLLPTVYGAEVTLALVALLHGRSKLAGLGVALAGAVLLLTLVDATTVSGVAGWTVLMNGIRTGGGAARSFWMSASATAIFAVLWRVTAGLLGLGACWFARRAEAAKA